MSARQLSPDGKFWWDGEAWQPTNLPPTPAGAMPITVSAGTAFKLGFFAFFGALVGSVAFWVLALIALVFFGSFVRGLLGTH